MKKIASLTLMALTLCVQHESHAMYRMPQAAPYIRQAGQRIMSSQPAFRPDIIPNKFSSTSMLPISNPYLTRQYISTPGTAMMGLSLLGLNYLNEKDLEDIRKERQEKRKRYIEHIEFLNRLGLNTETETNNGLAFGDNPYYASERPLDWLRGDLRGEQFPGTPRQYQFEKDTSRRIAYRNAMRPLLLGSGGLALGMALADQDE